MKKKTVKERRKEKNKVKGKIVKENIMERKALIKEGSDVKDGRKR